MSSSLPFSLSLPYLSFLGLRSGGGSGGRWGRGGGERWRRGATAAAVGSGEVAVVDEHLGEGHVAALGEERGELQEEGRVHGEVLLVDGGAEPPQDGAHGVVVLVGPTERHVVEQHPRPLAVTRLAPDGGRRLRLLPCGLEVAEDAQRARGDADAVEDAQRRQGEGGQRDMRWVVGALWDE
uniref:Uncharacterized protein n=1 Tax=Oryza barthii TaxID=65489 RepID=A0A0D3FAB3_9ORYZ